MRLNGRHTLDHKLLSLKFQNYFKAQQVGQKILKAFFRQPHKKHSNRIKFLVNIPSALLWSALSGFCKLNVSNETFDHSKIFFPLFMKQNALHFTKVTGKVH